MAPLWQRILLGIAAAIFIVWRISRKWNKASAYSDAMAQENREQKFWLEKCKTDSRVQKFKQELLSKYPIIEGTEATSDNFIIKYITFYNTGKIVSPDDPLAQYISFFLKGKSYLIVSKNLATDETIETKTNSMSFNLSLPEWVKRKH